MNRVILLLLIIFTTIIACKKNYDPEIWIRVNGSGSWIAGYSRTSAQDTVFTPQDTIWTGQNLRGMNTPDKGTVHLWAKSTAADTSWIYILLLETLENGGYRELQRTDTAKGVYPLSRLSYSR
jgi:hypothetical protein